MNDCNIKQCAHQGWRWIGWSGHRVHQERGRVTLVFLSNSIIQPSILSHVHFHHKNWETSLWSLITSPISFLVHERQDGKTGSILFKNLLPSLSLSGITDCIRRQNSSKRVKEWMTLDSIRSFECLSLRGCCNDLNTRIRDSRDNQYYKVPCFWWIEFRAKDKLFLKMIITILWIRKKETILFWIEMKRHANVCVSYDSDVSFLFVICLSIQFITKNLKQSEWICQQNTYIGSISSFKKRKLNLKLLTVQATQTQSFDV